MTTWPLSARRTEVNFSIFEHSKALMLYGYRYCHGDDVSDVRPPLPRARRQSQHQGPHSGQKERYWTWENFLWSGQTHC